MFDDITSFGDLQPGDVVIEVGAGTGIATEPLVDRGLAVVAIEPAPTMAELAKHKLGDRSEVIVTRFEDWVPTVEDVRLIVCCNAWHWIEPEAGLRQVMRLLAPGGTLALAWTEIVSWGEEPFESRLADELGTAWPKGLDHIEASLQPIRDDDWFEDFVERRHRFSRRLDADTYVAVSHTYGGGLNPEQDDIVRRVINEEFGGSVTKVEDAAVYLTRHV